MTGLRVYGTVGPMQPDRKLNFLNSMVNQATSTMWVFGFLSVLLFVFSAYELFKADPKLSVDKAIPIIISIFGALPVPVAVMAANKKVVYVYLRDSWKDVTQDQAIDEGLKQHLSDRIEKLQDLIADKGLGILKTS